MSPASIPVSRLVPALRWAFVCWIIVFWRLDFVSLLDDGAHYAQLTREMIANRSWLVPLLDGRPYIDKPVFFHWLQGMSTRLLGEGELPVRLPSALASIALLAVTRALGSRVFGGRVADPAWLMLATVPATFMLARTGYLDMVFTTCLFGGIACILLTALGAGAGLQYGGYALIVGATLTKGPVALVLVLGFATLCWLVGGDCRHAVRGLRWKTGLAVMLVGSAPWFAWMYWRFGDTFVRDYIMAGHVFYLSPRSSASSSASGFYAQMFLTAFFPWSLVAIGYAMDTLRRWRAGLAPSTAESLLWLWIIWVLCLFTLARFRVDRYIYPAAPACCLLAARAWAAARAERGGSEFPCTRLAIFASALVLIGIAAVLAVKLADLGLDVPALAFVLPPTFALGGLALALPMAVRRFRPPTAYAPILAMVAAYGLIVVVGLPMVERARPARVVGTWLRNQAAASGPVALYGLERWHPSLRYYTTRHLQQLQSEDEAKAFLQSPGPRWVVMRRRAYESLKQAGIAAEVAFEIPIVVGSEGTLIRRQVWGRLFVVRKAG